MTHWREIYPTDHLGSVDLINPDGKGYHDITLTIASIDKKEVEGEKGKKNLVLTAKFVEAGVKPMILNRTNCKVIAKLAGSPDTEYWKMIRIIVFVKTGVKAFGDVVDALRIRDHKPAEIVIDPVPVIAKIQLAKTLVELKTVWTALTPEEQNAVGVEKAKNDMKAKIEGQAK